MWRRLNLFLSIVTIIIIMLTILIAYMRRDSITWINELLPTTNISTNQKVVAIACNVYEGNEELSKILEILEKENVKISFFIGGVWASRNPNMLLLLKKNGQDLQNHGYYHLKPSTLNRENNIKEIKNTERLIFNITNTKTSIFEPPYGDYDDNSLSIINELGYRAVTWDIDTIDWRDDANESLVLSRVSKKLHSGAIILTHPKPITSNYMLDLIKLVKSRGYKIITVKELLNMQ